MRGNVATNLTKVHEAIPHVFVFFVPSLLLMRASGTSPVRGHQTVRR
jgi:hypothetical protein